MIREGVFFDGKSHCIWKLYLFLNSPANKSCVLGHMMVPSVTWCSSIMWQSSLHFSIEGQYKSIERRLDPYILILIRQEQVNIMEVVYVLGNSISLNRKLDAPRTARDEKRRATHNEGIVETFDVQDTNCCFNRKL